jgi:hypothetical protein
MVPVGVRKAGMHCSSAERVKAVTVEENYWLGS